MRIRLVSRALCGLLVVGLLLMTGCAAAPELQQPTLEELLAEVNAAHQAIDNDGLRSEFILRQPVDENGEPTSTVERYSYYASELEPYNPDLVLTQEQMEEDVAYLFDALYACYGNYDQMGGQAAFDAAEQAILEECRQADSLRAEDFRQLLISHFAFIQDGHFQIQNESVHPSWYPFFFRGVTFYKIDGQYITADHKTVASVDGCDDLTELFKRSLSPEGEIVWYPVLLRDSTTCNETLTVHYTDDSIQVLQNDPYDYSDQMDQLLSTDQKAIPEVRYANEIPVLQVNGMQGDRSIPGWDEAFLTGAEILGNSEISILDLRFNPGGAMALLADWINTYAKTPVPANSIFRDAFTGEQMFNSRDQWVENDNFLVILTSKYTVSGSEWLIDAAYNLENVLLVGENAYGALIGSSSPVQLKNSKLVAKIGNLENIVPSSNDYFEECRGFYPDLWVPAAEAEELAVKLLEKNSKLFF